MASLLITNTLLRYLLIIGKPTKTAECQTFFLYAATTLLVSDYIYANKIQTANK
jgi:hypothetical protein